MILIYNILFPFLFLLFIPGMIYKLIKRPGYKKTFLERFSIFSSLKKQTLSALKNPIWIHAVSVGETVLATELIKKLQEKGVDNIVLSTTTTTGQELARGKVNDSVVVIYCPIDFILFVKRAFNYIKPQKLIIIETEIWPNMIQEAKKRNVELYLINARMSDNSIGGYQRFSFFIGPVLQKFNYIYTQTQGDEDRFNSITDNLNIATMGNLKFDQKIPAKFNNINNNELFGQGEFVILLAASTHPREEQVIIETYIKLKDKFDNLKLILIPRHAERGKEIENILKDNDVAYNRRSQQKIAKKGNIDCLLADTTGEMLSFMNLSDIVIMGKSIAGHDEGHNLIEPALLNKPIITGSKLKNFRVLLNMLKDKEAIVTISSDDELESAICAFIEDKSKRIEYGNRAQKTIAQHAGATDRIIKKIINI